MFVCMFVLFVCFVCLFVLMHPEWLSIKNKMCIYVVSLRFDELDVNYDELCLLHKYRLLQVLYFPETRSYT